MIRKLHSILGLSALLLVVVLAITGVILSINPTIERSQASVMGTSAITVAELTGKLASRYPQIEQLQRTPSGTLIVFYTDNNQAGADRIDPFTANTIGPYTITPFKTWLKNLHRSYLLDTPGRIAVALGALVMLLLSISGTLMLVNRAGGWRYLFRPIQGSTLSQRLHSQVGRLALIGLLLSAITGLYMSLETFEFIPDHQTAEPAFPDQVDGGEPAAIGSMAALKTIPVSELRELVYPYPQDAYDVYSITTQQGMGFIDQSTGQLLAFEPYNSRQKIYEFIYMLHTGEGLWWLALILGLSALTVPLMTWTGIQVWWRRRRAIPRISNNSKAPSADSVILVGSENNSTWGFAENLHNALNSAGYRVHTAAMNKLADTYPQAKRLFILTATYGDGDAPASAKQFLKRLAEVADTPSIPFAVLGFGDRQFPKFCGYAQQVADALKDKGWPALLATEMIDRQSSQTFARWGEAIGQEIGTPLTLDHTPPQPKTVTLQLAERINYGERVQAPTSVLRFKMADQSQPTGWFQTLFKTSKLPHFEAGDLVGILPPGSVIPRYYSLASASVDGVLEICVRQVQGGLCSNFLHNLNIGETIEAFIQDNPQFRPASGKQPIILIGAGTGLGPLIGFIRNNKSRHPMYLYWGGRNPDSDFLYEQELKTYLSDQRLSGLNTAFSRIPKDSGYVQDKLLTDAEHIRALIQNNAQILVCGGRKMAGGVVTAMNDILAPIELDVTALKTAGRYREDVY
ncbi:PepSY domain-containing protein [Marinicella gelatinilytica]|uniref:PepSY domain-containing protein n=2 Tax=Gammaproteobacteria TaxID=1236 RepID=UPI002260B611|nr:PepSY domain-containing protein [Marinicella gelatinilytica]MCX7546191.1 PepSY domain-containing protein [Marinicella gelatinilytica]